MSRARLSATGGAWTSPLLRAGVRARLAHAQTLRTAQSAPSARTWYGLSPHGTSRLPPRPGRGGTRRLRSPPLPVGFRAREKPGLPVLPPPLLQFPRCLPAPPQPGCPRWPPGPSHCPTMSAGGRCRGGPRTRGGGTALGVGGLASPPESPWPALTDGRACAAWRGARRQLARAGWHFRSRASPAVWRQNGPRPLTAPWCLETWGLVCPQRRAGFVVASGVPSPEQPPARLPPPAWSHRKWAARGLGTPLGPSTSASTSGARPAGGSGRPGPRGVSGTPAQRVPMAACRDRRRRSGPGRGRLRSASPSSSGGSRHQLSLRGGTLGWGPGGVQAARSVLGGRRPGALAAPQCVCFGGIWGSG